MTADEWRKRAIALREKDVPYALMGRMAGVSRSMMARWAKGERGLGEENFKKVCDRIERIEQMFED